MKSTESMDEKQLKWKDMAARVDKTVDGMGKPVDRGIKEGVIALNILGINTTASCAGHLNWGVANPWIDVNSKEYFKLIRQLRKIDKTDKQNKKQREKIRKQITIGNLAERKKLIPYLDEFYRERAKDIPYDARLEISRLALGWSRLESSGVDLQEFETNVKKKKKRLAKFQAEMKAFSGFLKNKFFNG